jgi:phenylacetate-CoA ligase
MNAQRTYWNPFIETMPVERLRELQLKKFKRALHWGYNNSPFYRRLYREAGLEPGDIKTHEDIRRVPKVE